MADRLYKEYDPATLKKLQDVELEVLLEFDRICKEEGLVYFIHYGALLGALRHKGFIPWDDDIDIGMPRKDYEKFVQYCENHPSMDYAYIDAIKEKKFTKNIPLFYKKGTVFATDDIGLRPGIGIDIFVYDYLSENTKEQKKQINRSNMLRRLYYLCYRDPIIPFSGLKYWIAKTVCKFARFGLRVLHISPQKLYGKFEELGKKANKSPSQYMTTFFSANPYKSRISKDQFEVISVKFEGKEVYAPKKPDTLLRQIYGNYMEIPPVEKRVNHCPLFLDFGDGDVLKN